MTEHNHQKIFVAWCRSHDVHVMAIPNGGARNIVTAKHLQDEGVLAGAPDLFIPIAADGYHGLFIEMKMPGGRLTKLQREVGAELSAAGYCFRMCRGHVEAQRAVGRYLSLAL